MGTDDEINDIEYAMEQIIKRNKNDVKLMQKILSQCINIDMKYGKDAIESTSLAELCERFFGSLLMYKKYNTLINRMFFTENFVRAEQKMLNTYRVFNEKKKRITSIK